MWRRPEGPWGPPMPWCLGTGAHLPARMSPPACLFSRASGIAFPLVGQHGGGRGEALGSRYFSPLLSPPQSPQSSDTAPQSAPPGYL